MRILVVIDDYLNQTNGMCISTQRFVHEFKNTGQQVRIMATCNSHYQTDYPLSEWVIPFFRRIIAKEGFHLAWPQRKIIKKAVSWADIVLIETPFPLSWLSARVAKKQGKPVIGTFHLYPGNITESLHLNNRFCNHFFMWFFKNISFKNCTAIQCPTEQVKRALELNHFRPQLYVNTNGIDLKFIQNPHKNRVGHPFTILCIGRFSREKHQETLFKAMQQVEEAKKIHLILAGQGPLQKKYSKLAQELPNQPTLKLFTPQALRQIMSQTDLIVHCADVEIEGMACMEAFAAGCVPIIAESKWSSTSAYALSPNNKFPAGNSQALAKKIEYWYHHPQQLKQASQVYRHYAKHLTVKRSAQRYLKVMRQLLKHKK